MEDIESLDRELPFYLASRKHRFAGAMIGVGIQSTIGLIGAIVILFATPGLRSGMRTAVPLLEILILYVALRLWSIFTWRRGQTPAHLILKMRVYSTDTGRPATWRQMALRCLLIPITYNFVPILISQTAKHLFHNHALFNLGNLLLFGIVIADVFWIFTGTKNQRLVDVFAHTVVLNECEPNPHAADVS